jgi:hypothetical protein
VGLHVCMLLLCLVCNVQVEIDKWVKRVEGLRTLKVNFVLRCVIEAWCRN